MTACTEAPAKMRALVLGKKEKEQVERIKKLIKGLMTMSDSVAVDNDLNNADSDEDPYKRTSRHNR